MIASRVALVTGASSGFGQAIAARLWAYGFQVFGTSRAPVTNPAGTPEVLPLDVCSQTSVQTCVQTCVQTILERTWRIVQLATSSRPPVALLRRPSRNPAGYLHRCSNGGVAGSFASARERHGEQDERHAECLPQGVMR